MALDLHDIKGKLELLSQDETALAGWLDSFTLLDGERAKTNLVLIDERLNDSDLLAQILQLALASADPDHALNILERLFDVLETETLWSILTHPDRQQQLLTVLGGSPFLAAILLIRAYLGDSCSSGVDKLF